MRPRTLRRRGPFYHRRRSRWRLNLTLGIIGVALAGFVVVDMTAGPPLSRPSEDTAKRIAAPAPHAPAQTAPAELGSTTLVVAAAAPVPAGPPRPGRPIALVAGPASDVHRHGFAAAAGRLGAPNVGDVNGPERAPAPKPLAQRPAAPPEGCKTCRDDVPF